MANKNCTACTNLQTYAPDFVLNGVTEDVDASLRNDTGFDATNDRNDCTDLNDAADCLIGNMDADIDTHEVCDWKTYMHELVPNLYNTIKAIISAICGIWSNIHAIWVKIQEHENRLNDHENRLNKHEQRLNDHDKKLKEHDTELENHEGRIGTLEGTVKGHGQKLEDHGGRLGTLEGTVAQHTQELEAHEGRLAGHDSKLSQLEAQLKDVDKDVTYMFEGAIFRFDEVTDNYNIVAGKGVSFLDVSEGDNYASGDIYLQYIAGGLVRGAGSLIFHTENWKEKGPCYNLDQGTDVGYSSDKERIGNEVFGEVGRPATGGELLYELRLRKKDYPQILELFNGFGIEAGGGAYRVVTHIFDGGPEDGSVITYAYGNHGSCDPKTGVRTQDLYNDGHQVLAGYWYIQLRLSYLDEAFRDKAQYSPQYFMGARMNRTVIKVEA